MTTFLLLMGLLGMGITLFRRSFCIVTINGESMTPALQHGNRVLSKQLFFQHQLEQDKIVIVRRVIDGEFLRSVRFGWLFPGESELIIKRLIGLPGDTVRIPLSTLDVMPRAFLPVDLTDRLDEKGNLVWHIPPKHCFVKGDGKISVDSVHWGPIPLREIKGIVVAIC